MNPSVKSLFNGTNTHRKNAGKIIKMTLPAAVLALLSGVAGASDTKWTTFTGSPPYSANVISADFSSATDTDSASIASSPSDPNNPSGNFSYHFHSNSNFVFTLTPTTPVTLSTMTFDVYNNNADDIAFTYSVAGGGSGNLATQSITADTSWTSVTENLSSISDANGGVITISGNTDSGGARIGNFDIKETPEPGSFALVGMGGACVLAFRRRRK